MCTTQLDKRLRRMKKSVKELQQELDSKPNIPSNQDFISRWKERIFYLQKDINAIENGTYYYDY